MKKYAKLKSLAKSMAILESFSIEQPELSITEISARMGIYKSNAYNILSTFEELGYVVQNPETSKYRLDIKVLGFSYVFNAHMNLQRIIRPAMQRIADLTRETVYLAVPVEDEVVYLDSCSPYGVIPARDLQGGRAPMYCTAIGKAMLAYLPDKIIQTYEKRKLEKFTEHTITSYAALKKELGVIRQQGYAIDNMEHEYGIKCIGMPIRKADGQIYAAISISGPSLRMDDEKLVQYAAILRQNISSV